MRTPVNVLVTGQQSVSAVEPGWCQAPHVFMLEYLRSAGVAETLLETSRIIADRGLSYESFVSNTNQVSLPFALALACGITYFPQDDSFESMLDKIPASSRARFILTWDALELEGCDDIVVWSETIGEADTIRRLVKLAKELQHFFVLT